MQVSARMESDLLTIYCPNEVIQNICQKLKILLGPYPKITCDPLRTSISWLISESVIILIRQFLSTCGFFSWWVWLKFYLLFIFARNQLLVSLIFAIVFFVSILFISTLIFMISFLQLTLSFVCSSFSSCFRCKVRLFIWDVSCFLRWDCIAKNFPLRTAFAASHRFWIIMLSFSFVSRNFFISSDFFSDPLVVQ